MQAIASSGRIRLLLALAVVCAALVGGAMYVRHAREQNTLSDFKNRMNASHSVQSATATYRALLQEVGADTAQDMLSEVMPDDSFSHLIAHEAGRFLYEQKGPSGIAQCKLYFGAACFHGFVIDMMLEHGLGDVQQLNKTCESELTGDQQSRCAHGIGHGFLELLGYQNIGDALDRCKTTFQSSSSDTNFCFDGVFMEAKINGYNASSTEGMYDVHDPMYPCNETWVLQAGAHERCWITQSQRTLMDTFAPLFNRSIGNVTAYCQRFPQGSDRDICFSGISRQILISAKDELGKIRMLCGEEGDMFSDMCVLDALKVSYQFGDHEALPSVCASDTGDTQSVCYTTLFTSIALSYSDMDHRLAACRAISVAEQRASCIEWMGTPAAKNFYYAGDTMPTI